MEIDMVDRVEAGREIGGWIANLEILYRLVRR